MPNCARIFFSDYVQSPRDLRLYSICQRFDACVCGNPSRSSLDGTSWTVTGNRKVSNLNLNRLTDFSEALSLFSSVLAVFHAHICK